MTHPSVASALKKLDNVYLLIRSPTGHENVGRVNGVAVLTGYGQITRLVYFKKWTSKQL